MFLKKIIISSVSGVIREVPFKRGLNLIVDDSTTKETESGNSIGKTTLLRAVDYCLGSEGKDIYTDLEFDTENQEIINFLNNNAVTFKLFLENSSKDKEFILERGFCEPLVMKINGEDFITETEYRRKLEDIFFGIKNSKPSIRQLMPKFIRKDSDSMSKTLKFLHGSTTNDDYELILFFLFGFNDPQLLSERFFLKKDIKSLNAKIKTFKNGKSLVSLRETLKVTEREINKLEKKVKTFEFDDAYEKEVIRLNEIKTRISNLTLEISNFSVKLSLNNETLEELKRNKSKIDPLTINELYNEAKIFIPNLQKSFEDVLVFHNQLISKKIIFIENGLVDIKKVLEEKIILRKSLLREEGGILSIVSNKETLSDSYFLQNELNKLYEKKGQENTIIQTVEGLEKEVSEKEKTLLSLKDKLFSYLNNFESNISSFNIFFSEYSKKLYDEEYILSYEIEGDKTSFKIENAQGNVGGGKKKGQVASFDLAYISFLDTMNSKLFRFVMHDSIEDVHYNQINTLFSIANQIDGQYIVTVLRDKLTTLGDDFITENKILNLSEKDKFFKF